MDELTTLHPFGLFRRSEAIDLGYRDRHLAQALREKVIARTRHGVYLPYATWHAADELEKHRLTCRAALLRHGDRVALSHTSAAVMLGLRLYRPDLSQVHVVRLDGGGGRQLHDMRYHSSPWSARDVRRIGDVPVVDPVGAALGAASLTSVMGGVVVLDSLYDLRLGAPDEVERRRQSSLHHPNSQRLQMSVRLARQGSQSVGESICRCHFFWQRIPAPVLQYAVHDDHGVLIGYTDFAWPEARLLGEFDGKVKYTGALDPGQDPSEVVFREKRREDRLREATGFGMIRIVWSDLHDPARLGERVRRQLASAYVR